VIFLIMVLFSNRLYRDLIIINAPYFLAITCVSLVPVLVVKRLKWYPEAAPLYLWLLMFLITGYYYSYSGGPNIIGLLLDLITHRSLPSNFLTICFGLLTLSGIFLFFFYFMSFLSGKKDDFFAIRVDKKSYGIWAMTYVIYLNTIVSIVNPVFRHSF